MRKPRTFTYDELLALPQSHQVSTFHCVTGWTVHDVRWSGVRFKHLLDLVEPLPEAKALRFDSLEVPYNDSLTTKQVELHDVMLALGMDGQPLSRPHGSPARVVIPEMYGYKGVKWLSKIELVAHQPTGYWEGLGYDQDAWVGHSNGYGVCSRAASGAGAAPSGRCTGCTRPRSCVLLGSGLCLYLPSLAEAVGRRPLLKTIHIYTAIAWAIALVLVVVVGDRRSLRRTVHEVEYFDDDDRSWLTRAPRSAGAAERGPEAEHDRDGGLRDPVRGQRILPLVRRARHALPARERPARPRLPDVRLADPLRRAPGARGDLPAHAPLAERDHPRLGARGLGRPAAREVGRGGRGARFERP